MFESVRIIIGLVFLLSGVLKGLEFNTTAHTVSLYSEAFHLNVSEIIYLIISAGLIICELIVGLSFITKFYLRYFQWLALVLCLFFLVLTFVIAKLNLIEDCGCFGSALKLDSWNSFYKNILLCCVTGCFCFISQNTQTKNQEKYTAIILCSLLIFITGAIILPAPTDGRYYSQGMNISVVNKEHPIFLIDGEINNTEIEEILSSKGQETLIGFVKTINGKNWNNLANLLGISESDYKILVTQGGEDLDFIKPGQTEYKPYRIDEALYDNVFLSNYGIIKIKENEILYKMDFNVISLSFWSHFKYRNDETTKLIMNLMGFLFLWIPICVWIWCIFTNIKSLITNNN